MFLRRSLVHISYMIFFFMSVHLGACPPPPHTKSWLRYCCQLSLTRRVAKWRWPIPSPPPPPPTRYTKSPPLRLLFYSKKKWKLEICCVCPARASRMHAPLLVPRLRACHKHCGRPARTVAGARVHGPVINIVGWEARERIFVSQTVLHFICLRRLG